MEGRSPSERNPHHASLPENGITLEWSFEDMKSKIKLRPDYASYPLWWADERVGDIDPEELPLEPDIIRDLIAWSDAYDATFNEEYPPDSGFPTPDDEIAFEREGIRLWKELRQRLAPDYDVIYHSYYLRKTLHSPDELIALGAEHLL
ncbi:MAG TPA: hypothetical protein VFS21_16405 [Roseiflexaceae bacterium]|nr:hypothetical protein [Roseiflexaceae bacterium]